MNNYHTNNKRTIYQIADANWGMYHPIDFSTEEEARKVIESEYANRSKNDGSDEYWRNRKQVVLKITTIQEVMGEPVTEGLQKIDCTKQQISMGGQGLIVAIIILVCLFAGNFIKF